jgi:ABC-2 type transport system ATP-binding protein
MQRRLSLASTLVHRPQLLFLDEPTAGIDPVLRRKFWDYFEELKEAGTTLVVTTQYVSRIRLLRSGSDGRRTTFIRGYTEGLRARLWREIVDLAPIERITFEHVHSIFRLPFIRASVDRISENEARILVDEASTAMPALVDWTKENNLTIESIQEYIPPFDDVFVKLIQRYENNA